MADRRPVQSTLHGVPDVDEYGWLRDVSDPAVTAHLRAERAHYDAHTAHLAPLRDSVYADLVRRTPPTDRSVSWSCGDFVYYTRSAEGREYAELCRRAVLDGQPGPEEVLLDLERVAGTTGYAALGVTEVSPDGRWLAWSVDTDGDEIFTLRFRDLRSGFDLPEAIEHTYYTGAWSADSSTFLYVVHDEAFRPYLVRRHLLGTDPAADAEVLSEPDAAFEVTVRATRDGELVVLRSANRDTSECWLVPSQDPRGAPRPVLGRRRGVEYDVEHLPGPGAGRLLVLTNEGAEQFEVRQLPLSALGTLGERAGDPLVPGRTDVRVLAVHPFRGHLVLSVRRAGRPALEVRDHDGVLRHVQGPLREAGLVALGRNVEFDVGSVVVRTESLVDPPTWWDLQLDSGTLTERHRAAAPGHDPDAYRTERIELPGEDGVAVPVTLAYRAEWRPDGSSACLLYGYGAYESCVDPTFDVAVPALLDRGVLYAIAHVRGGGELGRGWWQQGRLGRKRTTFTDFVAVGRGLVAAGYAAPDRLGIRGLSAGGLLMGAAAALAPQLWRAVLAEVPFVDVVHSMLDPTIPLTVNEWDEWGDPRDPEMFAYLRSYSPYENLPASPRPAMLVTGSMHDPRVLVHEPAKWVSRLRATAVEGHDGPLLFRVELGAGAHVGPAGRYQRLAYEAEVLAWLLEQLGAGGSSEASPG